MATILELLNQGIGGLNTPLGQLGTQLLANSGPQPGNPGGGARMGQAFMGMQQQQAQQQQRAYQAAMAQNALSLSQSREQDAQSKQEMAARMKQLSADPEFLSKLDPLSRQLAAAGLPLDDTLKAYGQSSLEAHRQQQAEQWQQSQERMAEQFRQSQGQSASQFAQSQARMAAEAAKPKAPAPRQVLDEPLGGADNLVQRHIFDASTNSYRPYGKPFKRSASTDELAALLAGGAGEPDENAGPGAAVPGLPGANATGAPPSRTGADLLMHGSGSNPMARPGVSTGAPAQAAPTGDLAAAKNAISNGAPRDAVITRLMQGGYTAQQIQAAGL